MTTRRSLVLAMMALCGMLNAAAPAQAQSYPTRPIKMIVPFPPGGPIGTTARLVAEQMSARLGQPVVVEDRPGAGATIGTAAAAAAEPDGYTLLFGSSGSLAVSPALYPNIKYDPVKSFAPVAMVSIGALLFVVNPTLPAATVKDYVAYAKANPGKLNYGAGLGTPPHVGWGLLKTMVGTDLVFIPYKGAAPAITDLLANQTQLIIDAPGSLLPHVEAGKLRALAVTTPQRVSYLPDVPTMVESGYPDFVMTFWNGVLVPAGTPQAIVSRLNGVINEALQSPELRASLAKFRVESKPGAPEDFGKFVAAEVQKWAGVIKAAGIKVD
jgi:tripartite-type tricarboxylate transporter receptor subunit TctC